MIGNFRYNLARGQLNNEKGGELETKSRQNGNRQRNNMIKCKQISFKVTYA